jgi:hypothetical protein
MPCPGSFIDDGNGWCIDPQTGAKIIPSSAGGTSSVALDSTLTSPSSDGLNLNTLGAFFGTIGSTVGSVFQKVNAPQPITLQNRPLIPFSSGVVGSTQTSSLFTILLIAVAAFFGFRYFSNRA